AIRPAQAMGRIGPAAKPKLSSEAMLAFGATRFARAAPARTTPKMTRKTVSIPPREIYFFLWAFRLSFLKQRFRFFLLWMRLHFFFAAGRLRVLVLAATASIGCPPLPKIGSAGRPKVASTVLTSD